MDALKIISEGSIKAEKPQFNVGDTVRVDVRIKEGERERIHDFKKKNGYKRSIELSKKYNLYRQNFCGCEFSRRAYEATEKMKQEAAQK